MVDVHDEYRPTGYSRTYPNLMTQVGIGGDESSPTNKQNADYPFYSHVGRSWGQHDLLSYLVWPVSSCVQTS